MKQPPSPRFLAAAVLLASAWPAAAAAAPAPSRPPNVLFVAIDDLNDWGLAALDGRKGVVAPNLERLAARGTLFLNAHCAAPACNPSRTAILTGVAPHRSGVYNNGHDWRVNDRLREVLTLPEYFRKHGYTAIGGGKIFHALEWIDGPSDGFNDAKCWDSFFPSIQRQIPDKLWPAGAPIARGTEPRVPIKPFDWAPLDEPIEQMPDHKVVDWAVAELQKPRDKPFFQAVGLFRPHIPWYVPRRFFELYPLDKIEPPYVKPGWREKLPPAAQDSGTERRKWHRWVVENNQWAAAVQGYLASISFCDFELGRLLDGLDRSPHRDNTIVVLWTDHGFHLGDKDTWEKFTLWSESTRVPFIVVAPGVTKPGATCARPVSLLDLYPTLLELAGLPANPRNDGVNLVPWLRDPARPKDRPALCTHERGNHALRDDRYHYIRYANGDEELYDMQADEGQWNNLAADPAAAPAKAALSKWLPSEDVPPQPRPAASGPARKGGTKKQGPWTSGDALDGADAPAVAGRTIRVGADFEGGTGDGVIVAQGGDVNGFALWVKDGRLLFTARIRREVFSVESAPLPKRRLTVRAVLAADGAMTLEVDGEAIFAGRAKGPVPVQPNEGLTVGFDDRSAVGGYEPPARFGGTIHGVDVKAE